MNRDRIKELMEKVEKVTTGYTDDEFNTAMYILIRLGKHTFNNYIDSIELDEIYMNIKRRNTLFNEELNEEVSQILNEGD